MTANLEKLSQEAVSALKEKGAFCTFAESLTGGLISATLVGTSGASEVFRGSYVTYCDEEKHRMLGVDTKVLEEKSAVSYECATQMAEGARRNLGAEVAVSATGYAGPGGGTATDPAGTFYIGYSDKNGSSSIRYQWSGTRGEVRDYAVQKALELLIERVKSL